MKITRYILLSLLTLCVCSCDALIAGGMNASLDDANILEKTAYYFGVDKSKIKIKDVNSQLIKTSYRAIYQGAMYNCSIYVGEVSCSRPGEE